MNLLIVAATREEIAPAMSSLGLLQGVTTRDSHTINTLVTGVGMVATAFRMGNYFALQRPDLAINLGIAGAFNRNLQIGETVEVVSDLFSELGAEDRNRFIPLPDLGFGEVAFTPLPPRDVLPLALRKVNGITVNTVHGNDESIIRVVDQTRADVETMEGAAFFYACAQAEVPSIQLRTVSNYVEARARERWDIPLAIKNLNTFASKFIPALLAPQVEV